MDTEPELSAEVNPSEQVLPEVVKVNFKDGTIVDKIKFEDDGSIPKVLREIAKFAKKNNVKSLIVMTINEDNHVDWVQVADSEHHLALAALCLDDIRSEIKDKIFGEDEE